MSIEVVKCPNCGANINLNDNQEFGFCTYCGTKVVNNTIKKQKITIENPIKIDGKVELVNNEFEAALAEADNSAAIFFTRDNPTIYDYNRVLNMYANAERLGAQESRLYLHLLDFVIKANIETKLIILKDANQFINSCDLYINTAIRVEKDEQKQKEIKDKYNKERDEILERFIQKINNTSNMQKTLNSPNKKLAFWILGIPACIIIVMIIIALVTA